tara:strand:+ start:1420 stop:1638 length:219 start_codon:yes stop_codon:yes gene_type:complete
MNPTDLICERLHTDDLEKQIISCDVDSLEILELLFEIEETYDIDVPREIDNDLRGGMTVGKLIKIVEDLRTT